MNTDKAISAPWAGVLAQQITPENGLGDSARQRIKHQLMEKISASTTQATTQTNSLVRNVRRDDGWHALNKKMQVKVLHDDGHTLSWLLKLAPGGGLPAHDHAEGAEECMVLEGQLRINGEAFFAGDYQIALPGSVHHEVASELGGLVYLRSPASRRKDLMGA